MDGVPERDSIPPPSKDRRWDIDERGEGIADASRSAPRIAELGRAAGRRHWVAEQPDLHLWPHIEGAIRAPASPWIDGDHSIDAEGCLIVELVHQPVDGDRARAVLQSDVLGLLGSLVEGTTYLEIEERRSENTLVVCRGRRPRRSDAIQVPRPHAASTRDDGASSARMKNYGQGPGDKWWRWGRVELPVQSPSPETTTSVSDGLSSTARTDIGTLPDGPVTCL